jgi:hypothetical protein
MADAAKPRRGRRDKDPGAKKREKQQEDLIRKLPEKTEPAQEWGERTGTGKGIASGGKAGKGAASTEPGKE